MIGFVIGDLFLFQAYVEIGSRISMLIMSAVPPITAITGYFFMGERITLLAAVGMLVTIAAIVGFAIVITVSKSWGKLKDAIKDHGAMKSISLGSFFGPFLGVSFSLMTVQYTATGIVATITSISPILIIPASIMMFKEKVLPKEIIGAFITLIGVTLLFI